MMEKLDYNGTEKIAGGASSSDPRYDLSNFASRTVNLSDPRACLTLRNSPGGDIIPRAGWRSGDRILIHTRYTKGGWFFAYDQGSGSYGFVNPGNIV